MIRRHPKAILMAAQMDPERRELYVEGRKDRLFFKWLTLGKISKNSRVIESSFVEISQTQGGEKERLLKFAKIVENRADNLRFFIDRDYDELLSNDHPSNVWSTDFNDMEGYLFEDSIIYKFCLIGCKFDKIDPVILFGEALKYAVEIGYLRLVSKIHGLKLSINKTKEGKYIKMSGGNTSFNFNKYLNAVIQNSKQSKASMDYTLSLLAQIKSQYHGAEPLNIVRGKDVISIFARLLSLKGVKLNDYEEIFWSAINEQNLSTYNNLSEVVNFLCIT